MNLNAQSRFAEVPQSYAKRSQFDLSRSVKTSFNVGSLVPCFYEEVLPGDTFSIDTNMLVRMQPLVAPIMDDIYLDFYYFFVPNRLVWEHWKEFMGESTDSPWYPATEYNVPHVNVSSELFRAAAQNPIDGVPDTDSDGFGTLLDYFGLPVGRIYDDDSDGDISYSCSQLPFRAYALIYNEWFRDQNLQDAVLIDKGDSDVDFDGQTTYGGALLKANKFHDFYTASLPEPQKGPEVAIPLTGDIPVLTRDYRHDADYDTPLHFITEDQQSNYTQLWLGQNGYMRAAIPSTNTTVGGTLNNNPVPDNLYADLGSINPISINSLRLALATQSFYEKNARGGTRYRELIKSHFNVNSPDARMQIPELLSYNRVTININQVVQNSASTNDSPLGRQAAYVLTADADNSFTKSFTEHGMVIGLACARYRHSYQQGINKRFSRRTMFDYYFPVFAHLGEQPVLNQEIFVSNDSELNSEVFGYQEAFADYRYYPDIVTGEMRSNHPLSLDVWHLADYYQYMPYLSAEWIEEDSANVDRVLAVQSDNANQIFADFYFKNTAVRVMPMYSVPGLPMTL